MDVTRRNVLIGLGSAAGTVVVPTLGRGDDPQTLGSNADRATKPVFRGVGQGMRHVEAMLAPSKSVRSFLTRSQHYANVEIRQFRVAIPVFFSDKKENNLRDIYFSDVKTFQVGIEPEFKEATSGIAPRIPVTFEGRNHAVFDPADTATWDGTHWYIISDLIELPTPIRTRAKYGLWTSVENDEVETSLPYSWTGSNAGAGFDRHAGSQSSASSQIFAKGGATDAALFATSVAPHSKTSLQGASTYFTPGFLLVEMPETSKSVTIYGDSIGKGVGTGQGPYDPAFGNVQGDLEGNMGIFDIGLHHDAGVDFVNFSKGAHGAKYAHLPDNNRGVRTGRILCNPTEHICGFGHNDVTQNKVASSWEANVRINPGHTVNALDQGIFICRTGGMTGGAEPEWSAASGATVVDGFVVWELFAAGPQSGIRQQAYRTLAFLSQHLRELKTDLPMVPIHQMTLTPFSTSLNAEPDKWAIDPPSDQTLDAATGDWSTRADIWNAEIVSINSRLFIDKVIDFRPELTFDFERSGDTKLWSALPSRLTADGTHLNNVGNDRARSAVQRALGS